MSEAVFEERFVKLVEDNGGFEYYQAYRNDVDHILGGKGNTFSIEDAMVCDEMFSLLMGDKVEPRRVFIEQNAKFAENLDV